MGGQSRGLILKLLDRGRLQLQLLATALHMDGQAIPCSLAAKLLAVKDKLLSRFHADLHCFPSFHAKHRKKIGPAPYFNARSRKISVALHRLRSGPNPLNSHRFKFDSECQSPNCRNGCNAQENACHVLLNCPFFDRERHPLRVLFTRLTLPFTSKNERN
jgi:hypothetical protein